MGTAADPLYLRVLDDLRAQIRDGVLAPGARVPSRNAIITRYGVGETAAKHALQVLLREGLIETRAGSGSYVRRGPAACHLEHDRPHFPGSPFGLAHAPATGTPSASRAGATLPTGPRATGDLPELVSWEHRTDQVGAPRHVARRLGLAEEAPVTRTRYLLSADGHPVQAATSYESAALTAGTPVCLPEEGPLAGRGVAERMRAIGVIVEGVVEDISVRPSSRAESSALRIQPGSPVLLVEREYRSGGRAVEFAEIVVPDRFRLRYRIPAP